MDISTFYALFSATCFALLGFWWNLLQGNPQWLRDPETRASVGGVYLSFLLPGADGAVRAGRRAGHDDDLADQLRGASPLVGLVATLRALPHSRRSDVDDTANRIAAVVLYALIAVVGLVPEIGELFNLKASRSRRSC